MNRDDVEAKMGGIRWALSGASLAQFGEDGDVFVGLGPVM
jgi:hypothetical protein